MFESGLGVEQNLTEAFNWFSRSAEQGDANGQCNLGRMYASGSGVEMDLVKAYQWLASVRLKPPRPHVSSNKRASVNLAGRGSRVRNATRATSKALCRYFDAVVLLSVLTTCTRRLTSASGWLGSFSLLLP